MLAKRMVLRRANTPGDLLKATWEGTEEILLHGPILEVNALFA